MKKINLVVADPDSGYLDKLADFIASASEAFRVRSFTEVKLLEECLQNNGEAADILLAHPEFLGNDPEVYRGVGVVAVLGDGRIHRRLDCYKTVNRFQRGDRLVNELVGLYSPATQETGIIGGDRRTRVVSVYSPAGGTGKTSVAIGLARSLSEMGIGVLFLGLESLCSSAPAFPCAGTPGLSHLMLGLSEDRSLTPVRFETLKISDGKFNIDFLEPPACYRELAEMHPDDLLLLLTGLTGLALYDVIIVDTDSDPGPRIRMLLEYSDTIVLVVTPDNVCLRKTGVFLNQAGSPGSSMMAGLTQEVIPVMNRSPGHPFDMEGLRGLNINYFLPVVPALWTMTAGHLSFDEGGEYMAALKGLARELCQGDG